MTGPKEALRRAREAVHRGSAADAEKYLSIYWKERKGRRVPGGDTEARDIRERLEARYFDEDEEHQYIRSRMGGEDLRGAYGLRGPAEAALLDRASLAFDEGDLEEGEEYLAAVRETHMSRARSGRYPTPEEIAEYDRLSRRRAELLAPIAEAERGKDRPRYIGSLRGLRGHCEDAIREATENLRRAKTPAQRRAAQKYMKQVKSRCGLGRLRGPRLGGKR